VQTVGGGRVERWVGFSEVNEDRIVNMPCVPQTNEVLISDCAISTRHLIIWIQPKWINESSVVEMKATELIGTRAIGTDPTVQTIAESRVLITSSVATALIGTDCAVLAEGLDYRS
jgi:hypothetical protein